MAHSHTHVASVKLFLSTSCGEERIQVVSIFAAMQDYLLEEDGFSEADVDGWETERPMLVH